MYPAQSRQLVEDAIMASYPALYRLAYTYVKNRDDAMDVVQESVCKAIAAAGDLRTGDALKSWLLRITANTALDFLRRRGRESTAAFLPDQGREDVYRDLDTLRALDCLTEGEQTVVVLRFFHDQRLQDIAQITGQPLSTVKTTLYRSLRKLKAHLTEGESL